jgi:hypothetical protein
MTTEEARNTGVNITKTKRGTYGNAHIIYDMNGGLMDIIVEVEPTAEQRAEKPKAVADRPRRSTTTKEKEHEANQRKVLSTDQNHKEAHERGPCILHAHT